MAAVAGAAMLGACAQPQGPSLASRTGTGLVPPDTAPVATAEPRATVPAASPAPARPKTAHRESKPEPRALPDDPALAAIGAPDAPRAARLVGMSAAQVGHLFGEPDFTRIDKPAEVRQYRNDTCVLDVFLYPDDKTGGFPNVAHAEVRRRGDAPTDETSCLTSLLKAHWLQGV